MARGTVCYLHGVGGLRPDWAGPISGLLLEAAPLDLPRLIAPTYSDLLAVDPTSTQTSAQTSSSAGEPDPHVPGRGGVPPSDTPEAATARLEYIDRQRRLAEFLAESGEALPEGTSWPALLPRPTDLPDRIPLPRVIRTPVLGVDQVGRYLDDERARDAVAQRVLARIVESPGPVTIVAHSLGSLVALDVISRLPDDVHIGLLLTLGSPMGHPIIAERMRDRVFPYDRVGGWVNAVHLLDPIPFGRGLGAMFPAAHDVFLPVLAGDRGLAGLARSLRRAATAHLDTAYLASETVRRALVWGVHGAGMAT